MNEQWRDADRDAHEAKAGALEIAAAQIEGVREAVSTPVDGMIAQLVAALHKEADAHRQKAKLVAA